MKETPSPVCFLRRTHTHLSSTPESNDLYLLLEFVFVFCNCTGICTYSCICIWFPSWDVLTPKFYSRVRRLIFTSCILPPRNRGATLGWEWLEGKKLKHMRRTDPDPEGQKDKKCSDRRIGGDGVRSRDDVQHLSAVCRGRGRPLCCLHLFQSRKKASKQKHESHLKSISI